MKTAAEKRAYQRAYYQVHKEAAKAYQKAYNKMHQKPTKGRGKLTPDQGVPKDCLCLQDLTKAPAVKFERYLKDILSGKVKFTLSK